MDNLKQLLKLAQDFQDNEIIASAKGKYQFPKSFKEIIKKARQWQLKK
jgi:hypothetical protein